jgi:perosamine synthetase
MDPIMEIAKKRKIFVIEDAAEAHGAEYRGRRAGSLGHAACFSFYTNKIITTGEGGMVVTDDAEFAARCRKLRDQGNEPEKRFWHREMGFNYRMTNMQAGVGLAQMKRIDEFVETRRRNAKLYNQLLGGFKGVTLPPEQSWAKNVFWMYSLLVNPDTGVSRDELMSRLKASNIDSRNFFHAIHRQPVYEKVHTGESLPVAEDIAARGINLPSGNELTEAQVRRVAAAVIEALSR